MQSEYERLKREGYTEEEINVILDDISKINISSAPMSAGRDDRSVRVSDSSGRDMKTSSIMMGYNKDGVQLGNGEFINFAEVEHAMRQAVFPNDENRKVIYKVTGKVVSVDEMVSLVFNVLKEKEQIILGGKSDKITNQQTAKFSIKGADSDKVYDKGVFMLGNDDLQLANGVYIKAEELEKALADYVVIKPSELPFVKDTEKSRKNDNNEINEKKKCVKMERVKVKIAPLILAGTMFLASVAPGLVVKDYKDSVKSVGIVAEQIDETIEKSVDFTTGQKVIVDEGVEYHRTSDWQYRGNDVSASFGNDERAAGTYTLDYFSVIHNGNIIKVECKEGQNLSDMIDKVCAENNIEPSELDIKFHIGGPVSGWVSMDDIAQDNQIVQKNIVVENEYHAYQNNFDGYVNVQTDDGLVKLNLLDENGNLISPGSVVKGSDGNEYRISNINQKYEAVTGIDRVLEKFDKSIEVDFHGINKELALASAGMALGLTAFTRRKEKKEAVVTEEEYAELLNTYKEKWDKDSKFVKTVNGFKGKTPDWERINMSLQHGDFVVDKISELYDKEGISR